MVNEREMSKAIDWLFELFSPEDYEGYDEDEIGYAGGLCLPEVCTALRGAAQTVYQYSVSEVTFCNRVPGVPDYDLCRYLCGAGAVGRFQRGHHRFDLGCNGIHGSSVLHPVQDRFSCKGRVLCPLKEGGFQWQHISPYPVT